MHQHSSFTSAKVAKDLKQKLASIPGEATVSVVVRYRSGQRGKLAKPEDLHVVRSFSTFPADAARLPARAVTRLAERDEVERIWLDFQVHAFLDKAAPAVGATLAWEAALTGDGVKVAILDTGIDPDHPDFGDRILAAANCIARPSEARDATARHLSTRDGNGHGTHIAGVVAGSGAASEGRYRGLAPEASLLVAKVLHDDGSGEASDVIAGLEWAFSQGAQVVCLSLGGSGSGDGTDVLSVACDEFAERGLVICVAAGNSGPGHYTIAPPGCAREVITVGAADTTLAHLGRLSVPPFSSRGPTSDRRIKPDLLFPGVGITSCRAEDGYLGQPAEISPEYYVRASGTSMAAPFAAGAACLLLQANPETTPRETKRMLCDSARSLNLDPNIQGHGLGNVAAALELLDSTPDLLPTPRPEPVGCLFGLFPAIKSLSSVRSAMAPQGQPAPTDGRP